MFSIIFKKIFGSKNDRYIKRKMQIVAKVASYEPEMQKLTDEDFPARIAEYKARVMAGEASLDELLPEVFALVREAGKRVLGMRHFASQRLGGLTLLDSKIA